MKYNKEHDLFLRVIRVGWSGKWQWRVYTSNGREICQSFEYSRKKNCVASAKVLFHSLSHDHSVACVIEDEKAVWRKKQREEL
jgi:hypothetical protein